MDRLSSFGELVDGIAYLLTEDLVAINRFLINTQTPAEPIAVLKRNELESSQARPEQVRYFEQTEDMFRLAAVLIESLIINHPFANANKRTASMAGYIFLLINGYELTAPEDDLVEITLGIATKKYTVQDLENWLCYWSRDYDTRKLCIPDEFSDLFTKLHFPFNN